MAETVISVVVSCNHFEFRVNQQTKGLFIVIIGFLIQQNIHGFRNQILVSIYPRCWSSARGVYRAHGLNTVLCENRTPAVTNTSEHDIGHDTEQHM